MPRSAYHHGDLRTALLAAGREALRVGRLESFSLRELSRTVGVTPTAAYRHFRDKEELLEAIAIAGFGELREALRASAPSAAGAPSVEALVVAYRSFAHAHADLVQLMFQPQAKRGANRSKREDAAGECLAEFVAAVADRDAGDDPADAIRAAVMVWSAVHGFAMLAEASAFVTLDPWMLPSAKDLAALGGRVRR
jgi:AcrR family transcriptional regulator